MFEFRIEAAFRDNEINETLKDLDVTAVGHRLKLLDAIAALSSKASGKRPSNDAATAIHRLTRDEAKRIAFNSADAS